jgi:DNA-directed RNA polymerase subunit RPC12/RpoP
MRKQYLHLAVYRCDRCQGPVITGSVAVRENEISKETDIREIGAACLSCGYRQAMATAPAVARHFPPVEWQSISAINPSNLKTAFVEMVDRASGD